MKEPYEWLEEDLQSLIREQRPEDLRLEYKRSDSLSKENKTEIAKDVSAMANSAGGVLVYGIDEQKKAKGPIRLDDGIDPMEFSREWLEQVIDSNIQRRIDGVVVNPVKIAGTGRFAYVIWVPQSNRAPHMAPDHRYYKRLGTITAPMEEYEVRDVGRRSESPDLHLDIMATHSGATNSVSLEAHISNRSSEPALYATCRLYIEHGLPYHLPPDSPSDWRGQAATMMLWNKVRSNFAVVHQHWSIPSKHPILEGERYQLGPVLVRVNNWRGVIETQYYSIGWEVRAPKTTPKLQGLKLIVDPSGPRIGPHPFTLTTP